MNQSVDPHHDGVYNISGSPTTATCRKVVYDGRLVERLNSGIVDSLYIPTIVYVSVLLCVGIPGNALVAYVYTSWRRSPSRLVIIALAVFDLVNCLFTIPTEIYFVLNVYLEPDPTLCKVTRFITFSMNNASSFVLLFIAMDRFKRIYKPLKPPFSNRITKTVIGINFALAFIFSWPSLLIYGRQTIDIPLSNDTCVRVRTCLIDDNVKTSIYPLMFNIILTAGTILIDIIMISVYAYIGSRSIKAIRETNRFFPKFAFATNDTIDFSVEYSQEAHDPIIRENYKKNSTATSANDIQSRFDSLDRKGSTVTIMSTKRGHSAKSSTQKAEKKGRRQMLKSTFMLFLVTVLFIGSFIPYCTLVFIRYSRPSYYFELSNAGKATYNVFLRSYMMSSALNPVIYSFLSSKFRKQCHRIGRKIFCLGQF